MTRQEQRERILEAASELLIKKGITVTTQEIASRAQTSDAQVLRLFENKKENIFIEVFKRNWLRVNTLVEQLSTDLPPDRQDPKTKLLLLYRTILEGIKAAGPFGTTFLLQGRQGGQLGKEFVKAGLHTFAELIDKIIHQGQQADLFRANLHTQAIRQQLIGCGESILLGWMWKDRADYPAEYTLDHACSVFKAILDGISAERQTSESTQLPRGRRNSRSPARGGGTSVFPPHDGGKPMDSPPQWKRSFGSYTNVELRALKFRSVKEFERAIKLCWDYSDLKGVPRDSPDGITLIVPEEAVKYFSAKGLKFQVSSLLSAEGLPREKLAEMRRKYGM